jgi:hypothetical protein
VNGILCQVGSIGERWLAGLLFSVKFSDHVDQHLTPAMIDFPREPLSHTDIEFLRQSRLDFLPEIEHHNELFHTTWNRR